MADRLSAYADWLVANQNQRGTPEFDTVANAYRQLRQQGPRDGALAFSVDQAQRMAGKGIEAVGNLVGSQGIANVGTGIVEQQQRDIAAGGYQPQYGGSLTSYIGTENFFPALGEKVLENLAPGGAAIVGTGAATVAALMGAPITALGIGGATLGGSVLLETGASAEEQEERTGDYDPATAGTVGVVAGILDFVGAGKVIPKRKLAQMTVGQVAEELAKKGKAREAAAFVAQVARSARGEALTELGQEGLQVAGAMTQGGKYTAQELVERGGDALMLGGTMGGGTRAAIDTAGAIGNVFPKGYQPTDNEAAIDFANRLQQIASENDLNLKDIKKTSTGGAREAIDMAHKQLAKEMKQLVRDLRQRVQVTDLDTVEEVVDKVAFEAGQEMARNKTKNTVGKQEMDATQRLVGDTREGQQLLRLMRQTNELTRLHNEGYQGGVSQYTDQVSPFASNVGYTARSAAELPTRLVGTAAGYAVNPAAPLVQGAAVAGGRGIDALTGRRSIVNRYVRQNQGEGGVQVDPGAPSLRDERRQEVLAAQEAAALDQQRRDAARARDRAMHAEVLAANAEYPSGERISPQQIMVDELGMSPQQVVRALKSIVTDPTYGPAARSAIRSFQRGGTIQALGMLIKKLERVMAGKQPPAMRDRPIKKGGLAVYQAQEAQRSAAVAQGIRDNQALNDQLQAALEADATVSEGDRSIAKRTLEKLRMDLTRAPLETAEAYLQDALNRASDPGVITKYVLPYVERVRLQQNARAASEAPTATEGMSAEPEINQMASSFQDGLQERLGRRKALEAEAEASPVFDAWTKPNRERVMNASYDRRDFNAEARRATAEAIGREARKRGLKVYHTSEGKDGRKTSRYIELPDGRRARVSDHDLPDTNQREYNRSRGIGVYDVEIIPDDWRRRSLDSYLDEMLFDEDAGPEINQMSGGPALFNNNVFDIPNSDYAKTNLDVRPAPEQVQEMREGTFKPDKKRTLVEAAQHLQDRFEGSANDPDPLDLTEENLERIAGMMATEGVYNIEQDGNAIGWYDRKLKAAKLVVSLVEPRIMQSPEAEQAFDFALAVTSNGQAVADNFEYALEVFRYFMDNGVMPASTFIKGGERNASMVAAFDFFNQYNASSQETTIADFLDTDFTVRELINFIDTFNEANGTDISVPSSEGMNEVVKGSYILGPKIGQGFYQNIRGNYDPLTMDIWWMRMWNRLTGRPFEDMKDEATMQKNRDKIERGMKDTTDPAMKQVIKEALQAAGVKRTGLYKDPAKFDEFIVQLDKAYQRYYKRYKQENGVNHTKPALFKATGTHTKNMKEQLQAQPKGPGERSAMRRATKRAIELLQSQGYDINTADFQALMWYPEKQLFRLLGVAPGRGADNDYLDAAKLLAEKEGKTYEQIQEALPAAERDGIDSGSSAFGQDGEVRTGAGADGSSQAGILYQKPIDFGSGTGDNGQLGRAPGLASSPVAGSREPTPTEIEQASRTVKAVFDIGKPGSQFENGVPDIDAAKKIAEAINVAVIIAGTPATTAKHLGKALGIYISPSRVKRTAGYKVASEPGPTPSGRGIGINTKEIPGKNPNYALYVMLHELGHVFETSPANPNDTAATYENVGNEVYSPTAKKVVPIDRFGDTFTNTFRDVLRQVLNVSGGKKADLKISKKDAEDIINEIINVQRSGALEGDARNILVRSPRLTMTPDRFERDFTNVRTDYYLGSKLVRQGVLTRSEVDSTLKGAERTYFHSPHELAADLLGLYMLDPAGARHMMPKATRLARLVFRDNPTIQFFSLPFASIVAMVLANMLVAEGEEEDMDPGALSMGAGALTA